MAKVTFISTTITSKGRYDRGESESFPEDEAKELQRLSSVESPEVKKKVSKPRAKKVKDESKAVSKK